MIPCPPLDASTPTAQTPPAPLEPCPFCDETHPEHVLKCTNTDMPLPLRGRLLSSKFRFIRTLGKGGMASVWLALNTAVDREVAIKLIRPEVLKSEDLVARFRSEAKAAGRIAHPNICDILDFGVGPVGPYIVMEYLRGKNLSETIKANGYLDAPRAVEIVLEALEGLEAAHARGIVHRDLKPENVFLHRPVAGAPIVKLMDFGVAKFTDGTAEITTEHGALLGTPEYMAPEQFKGADLAELRTDVWAVGAILYRALTGKHAFKGPTVAATLLMVTHDQPPAITSMRPAVPEALEAVVDRCLSKRIEDRYPSIAALRTAIRAAMEVPTTPGLASGRDFSTGESSGSSVGTVALSAPGSRPDPLTPEPADTELTAHDGVPAAVGDGASASGHDLEPPSEPASPATQAELTKTAAYVPATHGSKVRPILLAAAALAVVAVLAMRFWPSSGEPSTPDAVQPDHPSDASARSNLPDPEPRTPEAGAEGQRAAASGPDGPTEETPEEPPEETPEAIEVDPHDADAAPKLDLPRPSTDVPPPPPRDLTDGDPPLDPVRPSSSAAPETPELPPEATDLGGGYVLAKKRGKRVNHGDARKFCEALAVTEYGGIRTWKLPFPGLVKRIQESGEVRSGRYWTSARWRGNVTTFTMPNGQLRKGANADRRSARPLCVAAFDGTAP